MKSISSHFYHTIDDKFYGIISTQQVLIEPKNALGKQYKKILSMNNVRTCQLRLIGRKILLSLKFLKIRSSSNLNLKWEENKKTISRNGYQIVTCFSLIFLRHLLENFGFDSSSFVFHQPWTAGKRWDDPGVVAERNGGFIKSHELLTSLLFSSLFFVTFSFYIICRTSNYIKL